MRFPNASSPGRWAVAFAFLLASLAAVCARAAESYTLAVVPQYDQRNISANQSGSLQQSFATRQAAGKYPVTLYVSKDCGKACEDGRAFLKKRTIPFSEQRIESAEDVATYKARIGAEPFVPTLLVGREKETGFAAPAWDNLLDKAGYPAARR